jgi:hypothetical protein
MLNVKQKYTLAIIGTTLTHKYRNYWPLCLSIFEIKMKSGIWVFIYNSVNQPVSTLSLFCLYSGISLVKVAACSNLHG